MEDIREEREANRAKAQAIMQELARWRTQSGAAGDASPQMPEQARELTASAARRALAFLRDEDQGTYQVAERLADAGQLELVVERLNRGGLVEARLKAEQELVRVREEIRNANELLLDNGPGGDDARRRVAEIAELMREATSDEPRIGVAETPTSSVAMS